MFRVLCFFVVLTFAAAAASSAAPQVAVIEDTVWSPDDAPRDGAAELGVLLQLAQLEKTQPLVGLVGIGDRRGIFQEGTQRGFEFAVRQGVPVVRLARGAPVHPPAETDLFINGGLLSPAAAAALLAECLARYGRLPRADSADELSPREHRALRAQLALYQAAFTSRQPATVAVR
ncbi:MAG TPA: hypothetical protein VEQ65_04600 [Opitutus sp.]|nr:hypothetical protein [Opitutus sp.]